MPESSRPESSRSESSMPEPDQAMVQEAPVVSVVFPIPKPIVRLHGSASAIQTAVRKALERAGQADRAVEFMAKASGGDVLRTCLEFVDLRLVSS
jgi:hypothetical protein